MVVLPANDPSLADSVPSNSQWFPTSEEAEAYLAEMEHGDK